LNKGSALRELGRNEEALEVYDQLVQLEPNHGVFFYCKGLALNNLGRFEDAILALEKAIELDSDYADVAFLKKGEALFSLGRYENAIGEYDKAILLDSEFAIAYRNKSEAFRCLGRNTEADEALEKAKRCELK
jgi:tetratricopeptide (TPR) repeat protein